MAKKKKILCDNTRVKKKNRTLKKSNPFEVKINRQKHHVLGQKRTKSEHGAPGISRSRAIKKRSGTLLKEYQSRHKVNKLVDKRLGEQDNTLTLEEKMMKRFALERTREEKKGSLFSLNEEEDLTHYGQSLSNIEKFDNPAMSDDDEEDDDDLKRMRAKIVAEEHFGGFLTKKSDEATHKSFKDKMEEVIALSKKYKSERQMENNERIEMTEKSNQEYKELIPLLCGLARKPKSEGIKMDDYDIAVRTMMFEAKGKATDRTKTEEEVAVEEKEKLEKLEADRIRRMKGIVDDESTSESKHMSADSLFDGYDLNIQKKDKQRLKQAVHFKDGTLAGGDDVLKPETEKSESDEDDEDDEEDKDGESADDGDDDDENDDEDGDDDNDDDDDDDGDDEDDNEESDADSYADLDSDEEEKKEEEKATTVTKAPLKSILKRDAKSNNEAIEKAKRELPYTFTAPSTYDDWLNIINGVQVTDQVIVVERILKLYHPSLGEGNKQKLEVFTGILIQYFGDLALQEPPELELMDRLVIHIYNLTKMSPGNAADIFQNEVMTRQEEFRQVSERKHGRGLYLGLDTLLMLKLISVILPTSDFQHKVTTPSLLFMAQMLVQTPVNCERDVVYGLYICNLCLEYIGLSKRYIPEVINFLHGIVFLAIKKNPKQLEKVFPPFKPVGDNISLLQIKPSKLCKLVPDKMNAGQLLSSCATRESLNNDQTRLNCISTAIELLSEFSSLYEQLPAFKEIFDPVVNILSKLPINNFSSELQIKVSSLQKSLEERSMKPKKPLQVQKNKPIPLKLFEPKVDEKWRGKKKKFGGTREFQERQALVHRHKKEMKGAARDIRRDSQFIARHQLKETLQKDAERKRKVKELYSSLANQEGEVRALTKGKKKKY